MDDIFLAALLQDIAILGVDRTAPDFYRDLPPNASHREISEYETGRLGIDHAELGAWLLQYWRLPEPLCRAVAWSHVPPIADPSTPTGSAACCIALGSECAELLLAPAAASEFSPLADRASEWMGIEAPVVTQVIGQVVVTTAEIERLFDMSLLQPAAASVILARARELLIPGPRQASGRPSAAQTTELTADMGTAAPNDTLRRDGLTGLYNRGYLDLLLRREFQAATNGHWPLSLVFVDLDRFKGINETYGHEAGDAVLVTTAKTIASVARDTDCVARYGGTEFVILLPGLASNGAEIFCERLIAGLRSTLHTIRDTAVTVTASVGLASHAPEKPFQRASHLIDAAERSAYFAKRSGRDRLVRHRSGGPTSVAKR
jgi:diguanylate cyclase (GGDEF)-like protein